MASYQKYKTKDGEKWLFKMYVGVDPETGKKKMTTRRGFKTKKEAQRAASDLQKEVDDGTLIKNDLTFNDVFNEWWSIHIKTIKPSTQYAKESKFNKHILPRFAKLKMKDITSAYCQKVINEIADSVETTSTASDIKIQANLVFKFALKREYISKNPMQHVDVPKKEEDFLVEDEDNRNFWTKEELKTFLTLAEDHMEYQSFIFFYTDFYTGMRKGELIALEWKDIDFNKNSIFINKTMFFRDGKEILQSPKKFKSKRTIAIDDKTSKLLRKWRSKQKEILLANGNTTEPVNVFIRPDMRPWRLAHPNDVLDSFIKVHNLYRITIHGIRHTHASLLFEAGATIKEVQARLGHKDIQTTMNVYTHVTNFVAEKTANTFQKYMEL
ncbi:tyrosine-type recombinase/integrase [Heyndrickxia sporothermodurans]